LTWTVTIWGRDWREAILQKKEEKKAQKHEKTSIT
jgi:hypothetical protein